MGTVRKLVRTALLAAVLVSMCLSARALTLMYDTEGPEKTIYIGMPGNGYLAQGGEVWQSTMIIDVHTNLPFGTAPDSWGIELVSGQELKIHRWGDEYNPNAANYYRWELTELPSVPGDSLYRITCTKNGETATADVTVHCEELEWPTGLSLGNISDEVISAVGETMIIHPEIVPEGWQIPGHPQLRWGFDDLADEFAECVPVKKEMYLDPYLDINDRDTLTFTKPGKFESTYVIQSGNVSVGRLVTFHILPPEWEMVLPEGTRSVEERAFAGTAVKYVYVPEGCTDIGKEAFLNSGLKLIALPDTVTQIGEDAFPENAVIWASEESYAFHWASENGYGTAAKTEN